MFCESEGMNVQLRRLVSPRIVEEPCSLAAGDGWLCDPQHLAGPAQIPGVVKVCATPSAYQKNSLKNVKTS